MLYAQSAAGGDHASSGVYYLNSSLVFEAVFQLTRGGQKSTRSEARRSVGVGKFQQAGISARFAGCEVEYQHLPGGGGKIFTPVRDTVRRVINGMDGVVDIEIAAIVPGRTVGQVKKQVAQVLITSGIFLIAGPQGYLVELNMLAGGAPKDHSSQAAITTGKRLALPILSGLAIPESQLLGGGERGQ